MRDLMQIAYEASKSSEGDVNRQAILFADALLEELKKLKGTDISPYLNCKFDVIRMCYVLELAIPTSANIFNTVGCDGE